MSLGHKRKICDKLIELRRYFLDEKVIMKNHLELMKLKIELVKRGLITDISQNMISADEIIKY
jgi:hypothetical protein